MPTDLVNDIDFVIGISELFDGDRMESVIHKVRAADDNPVSPAILKSYLLILFFSNLYFNT